MSDEALMRFAAEGQQFTISLQTRPYRRSSEKWDRDAIAATVAVRSRHFQGRLATTIWVDELWHLHRTLSDLHQQVGRPARAEWTLIEDALSLTFALSELGHLTVHIALHDVDAAGDAILTFSLTADQTYLPLWSDQIAQTLARFLQEPP